MMMIYDDLQDTDISKIVVAVRVDCLNNNNNKVVKVIDENCLQSCKQNK